MQKLTFFEALIYHINWFRFINSTANGQLTKQIIKLHYYQLYMLVIKKYQISYLAFKSFSLIVPGEGYSRNASSQLYLISKFLLPFIF